MKVLVTGSAGRVGRAIVVGLMRRHQVVGLDCQPCSTAHIVGDLQDPAIMRRALDGVEVIVHSAALHAPHVGLRADTEFDAINVQMTAELMRQGARAGIRHFVFTSTTALYGHASTPKATAGWVDEQLSPQPKTIYHRTKIAAETELQRLSLILGVPVTVLQMSRCFPEPADQMAVYRLNRGVDARDVASAHARAIDKRLPGFHRFIISGATPFQRQDCDALKQHAAEVIARRQPKLVQAFAERGWILPHSIDRVYDSSAAQCALGWQPRHGFESVLAMLDQQWSEVLPPL
ncbi:UDP-glucose 4-epimerase [Ferrimonas sediminum]|uniref:UDP-glucose 4-epimerase n=1 Tax=Ferrimonas sediminum TaxID=718193 RepID=A0A1G8LEV7_9GAMM|nr:NAD(P)-dependent oxidoreductase [Ferrimonas sediminum]SDI53750.1 UDP-glucose 4-epimerase [Ferrimonas sediminum]